MTANTVRLPVSLFLLCIGLYGPIFGEDAATWTDSISNGHYLKSLAVLQNSPSILHHSPQSELLVEQLTSLSLSPKNSTPQVIEKALIAASHREVWQRLATLEKLRSQLQLSSSVLRGAQDQIYKETRGRTAPSAELQRYEARSKRQLQDAALVLSQAQQQLADDLQKAYGAEDLRVAWWSWKRTGYNQQTHAALLKSVELLQKSPPRSGHAEHCLTFINELLKISEGESLGILFLGSIQFLHHQHKVANAKLAVAEFLLAYPEVAGPIIWDSKDLMTCFHVYCGGGAVHVVEALLSQGADPNAQCPKDNIDRFGDTPLMCAIMQLKIPLLPDRPEHRSLDVAKLLIQHGADPNKLSFAHNQWRTALSLALDDVRSLQLLLNAGANPNQEVKLADDKTYTPLMMCAKQNLREAAALLIAAGALKEVRCYQGPTAYEYAEMAGHTELLELLKPTPATQENP